MVTIVLARISHQLSTAVTDPGMPYCVALRRAPRPTVEYAWRALRRAPRVHAGLRRLAKKRGEKCRIVK